MSSPILVFPANQRGMSHVPVREQPEQDNSRVCVQGKVMSGYISISGEHLLGLEKTTNDIKLNYCKMSTHLYGSQDNLYFLC